MQGERGQTLLEALVALALTALVAGAFASALGAAARVPGHADASVAAADALDDLAADLRAATAYDPGAVAAIAAAGPTSFVVTAPRPHGTPVAIVVSTRVAGGSLEATATAGSATVAARIALQSEAPAPGATVWFPLAGPTPTATP